METKSPMDTESRERAAQWLRQRYGIMRCIDMPQAAVPVMLDEYAAHETERLRAALQVVVDQRDNSLSSRYMHDRVIAVARAALAGDAKE